MALCLLLCGPAQALSAQQRSAADSLRRRLEAMEEGPERVRTLRRLAQKHLHSHPDSATQRAGEALVLARDFQLRREAAASLQIIGNAHRLQGDFAQALDYLVKARKGFEAAEDKQSVAVATSDLGTVYANMGNLPEALKRYLRALEMFEKLGNEDGIAMALSNIGIVHRQRGNLEKALRYYERAVRLHKKRGDRAALAETYHNIGNVLQEKRAYERAAEHYKRSLRIFEEKGDQFGMASAYGNLGAALSKQGRRKEALKYLFKSAQVSEKLGAERHLAATYDHIGRVYRGTGELENALTYAKKGFSIAEKLQSPRLLREAGKTLSEVYASMGNYERAYHYYRRYSAAKDSIFDREKSEIIARTQIRYETKKKKQRIESLEHANRIQTLQAQHQRTVRNALLGGLGAILLLAGILYNRYRLKQKAVALLETKKAEINHKRKALQASLEEKELLVKEIHHRVKNNLQVISSLLNLQSRAVGNPDTLEVVRDVQSRVQAMALIHKKLYEMENLACINARDYVEELSRCMIQVFGADAEAVRCRVRVEDISLDVDTAVPLGLIINELLSNALQHAFPGGDGGEVRLALREVGDDGCELKVADDGVGLPAERREAGRGSSLGMTLVEDWTHQLEGSLQVENGVGVTYTIQFKKA